MTATFCAIDRRHLTHVSDMRLCWEGEAPEDYRCKVFAVLSEHCRVVVSYTGFAGTKPAGAFDAKPTILQALFNACEGVPPQDRHIGHITNAIQGAARQWWSANGRCEDDRTSVTIAGWSTHAEEPITAELLSPRFHVRATPQVLHLRRRGDVLLLLGGLAAHPGFLTSEDLEDFRIALDSVDPHAIVKTFRAFVDGEPTPPGSRIGPHAMCLMLNRSGPNHVDSTLVETSNGTFSVSAPVLMSHEGSGVAVSRLVGLTGASPGGPNVIDAALQAAGVRRGSVL